MNDNHWTYTGPDMDSRITNLQRGVVYEMVDKTADTVTFRPLDSELRIEVPRQNFENFLLQPPMMERVFAYGGFKMCGVHCPMSTAVPDRDKYNFAVALHYDETLRHWVNTDQVTEIKAGVVKESDAEKAWVTAWHNMSINPGAQATKEQLNAARSVAELLGWV